MIQEHELPSNDPLIIHFKKLAELYPFVEDRHNVVKITEKKQWLSCKKRIVDKELPIYINQIRNIMKHFECGDEAHVEIGYGNTKNTITCKKGIASADEEAGFKVNTCVVYVDIACEGGELVFYEDNAPYKTIQTHSCKVVMFEGSLYHKRDDYSNGHRLCVLFQFPRKS